MCATRATAAHPSEPGSRSDTPRPEPKILFQKFFKSVGPRTYAAQVKQAGNGNHFVVLTEGRRDEKTDQIRKTRLFVFGEDFAEFFRMLSDTAEYVRAHPVPDDVRRRREKFWQKQNDAAVSGRPPGFATSHRGKPAR